MQKLFLFSFNMSKILIISGLGVTRVDTGIVGCLHTRNLVKPYHGANLSFMTLITKVTNDRVAVCLFLVFLQLVSTSVIFRAKWLAVS